MSTTMVEAMSDRYEWVEIVEPRTQDHMYANLMTGECTWHPPSGVKIKKTCLNDNQWWELYDANTSRFYYYNASSQKTVWQKPHGCDIIPLAKLQNLKPAPDASTSEDAEKQQQQQRLVVHREMSTQTPVKKEGHSAGTGSFARTNTNPVQSNRHKQSRSNKTSVRGADKCLIDPVKEGFDPVSSLFNGLHNHFQKERNQRIGGKEEKSSIAHSGVKTSRTKCTNDAADSSSCQPFEAHRGSNDFIRFQRSEGQSKSGLPDGLFRISRPYTASRTGQSVCLPRTTKTESIDGLLLSPRLHSARRTETQCMPASSIGGGLFVRGEPTISQPQRSLESPKPLQPVSADAELAALATSGKAVNFKKSVMEASWTSADVDPRFGTSGRGNCHSSSYFRRQDSFPTARSSSRLNSWQASGQYQDVSQITAVQVTPRPKPRAFPRTNPSYVATQRRDGALGGSYRKVSEGNQLRMSPADVGRQAFYNPGKDNAYGGAQTLHASHLHYKDPVLAGEAAKRSVCKNEDYDSDTSQSSTSSELNDLLHQYTLDSRVMRPHAHQFASSLHCPSAGPSQAAVFSAGTLAADYEVASAMSGDLSPVGSSSFQKSRTGGSHPIQADGHGEQPKKPAASSREPVLTRHCRRNSEPDYVNISSRREHRGADASQTLKSQGKQKAPASPGLEDDEGSRNGGTLRVQDHSSPTDFPDNCEGNSDRGSALSTPSPQSRSRETHPPPPSSSSETHHPSLRRRKWLEKPTQQVRQSTLEKSLSLQAELTQHRPLSMIVPFGSDSNAIVSQVADSLLQQMDMERFVAENLNEHRKGLLGKTVPVSNLLIWTKDIIQKPMIRTENRVVKREAPEVFRLIQVYMGDKKCRDPPAAVALELLSKGWSCQELADEIFMQLCRQTTKNPRDESLLQGWELLGICLSFFGPSSKFQSYVDGHIFRTLDSRDHTIGGQIHNYAICCHRRLDRIAQAGSKRKPSLEEIEHSKKSLLEPSMFGGTLESIMDLQKDRHPDSKLPWIQTTLSEELLRLSPDQLTEGIFRVPGDSDEVNSLKARYDQWRPPTEGTDPHILASLLKLWYRELYEPLIPHQFYERCVDSYADAVAAVNIVAELPQLNKMVLSYLVLFLQKFASPDVAAVTKMDANNLAMVMAPNCLRCTSTDPQVLFNNARREVGFMRLLIQHLDTGVVEGIT